MNITLCENTPKSLLTLFFDAAAPIEARATALKMLLFNLPPYKRLRFEFNGVICYANKVYPSLRDGILLNEFLFVPWVLAREKYFTLEDLAD